ncbi:hypothetical protein PMIN06_005409 [Paraphaeosphaeria minitans]
MVGCIYQRFDAPLWNLSVFASFLPSWRHVNVARPFHLTLTFTIISHSFAVLSLLTAPHCSSLLLTSDPSPLSLIRPARSRHYPFAFTNTLYNMFVSIFVYGLLQLLSAPAISAKGLLEVASLDEISEEYNCPGGNIYFVAHPVDVLLYQNPDLYHDIHTFKCTTVVMLTTGDRGVKDTNFTDSLELGLQASYNFMAGAPVNQTDWDGVKVICGDALITLRYPKDAKGLLLICACCQSSFASDVLTNDRPTFPRWRFRRTRLQRDGSGFSQEAISEPDPEHNLYRRRDDL